MGNKRKKRDAEGQMLLFIDYCRNLTVEGGEVKSRDAAGQGSQKPVKEGSRLGETKDLMERAADLANLNRAWTRVKANKGKGGIDGVSVDEFGRKAWREIRRIREEMLEGKYEPAAVRGVQIPKPSGGVRQLGIPTIRDRIVQQALAQVLTPKYDRVFSESSYGFRPNRRAHDAVKRGSAYVADGYSTVVDLDLEKFFDKVNHDRLLARLAEDIADGRVTRLIGKFLKVGLMGNGVCQIRREGTPQGGPLSPLLANIVLDELDRELERRGHRFCRYADDCNIYVKSQKAGERVMRSITQFITRKLRLKVNEAKSKVAPSAQCTFLGYTIGTKGKLWIAEKSKERMRNRLKAITTRNRGRKLEAIIRELNTYLTGWLEYFKHASASHFLRETGRNLRRRIRCYRLKQCKRKVGIVRYLMGLGMKPNEAWKVAKSRKGWFRKADAPQVKVYMNNAWFGKLGLVPLVIKAE